jgi:hypothetical protein
MFKEEEEEEEEMAEAAAAVPMEASKGMWAVVVWAVVLDRPPTALRRDGCFREELAL